MCVEVPTIDPDPTGEVAAEDNSSGLIPLYVWLAF